METLKLRVNEKVLDKILDMLNQFKSEDVQIVVEETPSIKRLRERFEELNSKDAEFITLEELEANLDKVISKYEN